MLRNLYVYIPRDCVDTCLKYGMKLSEFSNIILPIKDIEKSGIEAFLSPSDNYKFFEFEYICLRVLVDDINVYILDKTCVDTEFINNYTTDISNYKLGSYEEPVAIIISSILPENIFLYNKQKDVPNIIDNSKDFYYKKSIHELIDSGIFSNFEIYQMLLILGEKKRAFNEVTSKKTDKLKLLVEKSTNKTYTKRSNF